MERDDAFVLPSSKVSLRTSPPPVRSMIPEPFHHPSHRLLSPPREIP
jgi:hypothetical protein